MRSIFNSRKRHLVLGYTGGSLEAAAGPRFLLFPTRVGRGGSHFFFG